MTADAWDDYVVVGLVTRPHGLRGDVLVRPETDFPEQRFAVGAIVYASIGGQTVPLEVASSRMHLGRPLVTFVGRTSIEDVAPLAGIELRVPESALTPLGEGEYYWFQYTGTPVVTEDGREVGRVARVEPTGGSGMLIVDGPTGEVQIPLNRELCPTLTPASIVVRALEGLLEVNAPTERRRENRHRHDLPVDGAGGSGRRGRRAGRPARSD